MATWILGDIHGRYDTLSRLWKRLDFDIEQDHLWLVGDLVNRGPRSLEVLRWVRRQAEALGKRLVVVLGNHDLYLLALHDGVASPRPKDGDLLQVLGADDRDPLMRWLRRQKLLHRTRGAGKKGKKGKGETILVHAGLLPEWSLGQAEAIARRLEARLSDPTSARVLLERSQPAKKKELADWHALEGLTRLRMIDAEGLPCSFKGHPEQAPRGCRPWFRVEGRKSHGATVIFGHWAALGLCLEPGVVGLDSGCAWGKQLSAYRLEDGKLVQQKVIEPAPEL